MNQNSEIDIESHLNFINSLKIRDDKGYWLVFKENEIIGVITFYLQNKEIAEIGNYVNPVFLNRGLGLLLNYYTQKIGFELLGMTKLTAYVKKTNKEALRIHKLFLRNLEETKRQGEEYLDIFFDKNTWEKSKKSAEKLLKYTK